MSTNCSQSAEAEDICTSLERAVLKFFVGPIEDVDTFLFAEGDDSAVGDVQTACLPRPPTATDFQLTLFSAELRNNLLGGLLSRASSAGGSLGPNALAA